VDPTTPSPLGAPRGGLQNGYVTFPKPDHHLSTLGQDVAGFLPIGYRYHLLLKARFVRRRMPFRMSPLLSLPYNKRLLQLTNTGVKLVSE
jgi:hypothetical protein